jgi:hypothetical protein
VNQDDTAVLVKIRCKCQSTFSVSFEFRRAHRKKTNLIGYYSRLPACKESHGMLVKNISQTGIGFVRVTFTLDDAKQSKIEKNVVVRVIEDKYVGCEFTDPSIFDKTLGFYLMP